MTLTLSSPAFREDGKIPDRYAREESNLSPPLEWSGAPEGTRSFALLVEDPDAPRGMFRHWAVHDIPPDCRRLDEGAGRPDSGLRQGANDFGNANYDGPQPPEGDGPHHYHIRLAALDTDHLDVGPRQRAEAVWDAAQGHILEETELVGIYER
jgi:hypothetical protein